MLFALKSTTLEQFERMDEMLQNPSNEYPGLIFYDETYLYSDYGFTGEPRFFISFVSCKEMRQEYLVKKKRRACWYEIPDLGNNKIRGQFRSWKEYHIQG